MLETLVTIYNQVEGIVADLGAALLDTLEPAGHKRMGVILRVEERKTGWEQANSLHWFLRRPTIAKSEAGSFQPDEELENWSCPVVQEMEEERSDLRGRLILSTVFAKNGNELILNCCRVEADGARPVAFLADTPNGLYAELSNLSIGEPGKQGLEVEFVLGHCLSIRVVKCWAAGQSGNPEEISLGATDHISTPWHDAHG